MEFRLQSSRNNNVYMYILIKRTVSLLKYLLFERITVCPPMSHFNLYDIRKPSVVFPSVKDKFFLTKL